MNFRTPLLFLLVATLLFGNLNAQDLSSGLKIGDPAPSFNLKNTEGDMISTDKFSEDEGMVVIFTCNHCPFSKLYEDRIISMHEKWAPKGFPVVAINPNDPIKYPSDNYEAMKKRAKKKKFPFDYLVDETQEVAKAYGAKRTPHVFIVKTSEEGNKVVYMGGIDNNAQSAKKATENYIDQALTEILDSKAVSLPETKATGCSIKWAD